MEMENKKEEKKNFLQNILKREKKLTPEEEFSQKAEMEYRKGLATVKDLIAPSYLEVNSNFLRLGDKYIKTLFIFIYPRFLRTNWFSPIVNLDSMMDVSMFVHPMDSSLILKQLKKQVTRIQSQISINQEKGKVRDPILETAFQDAEDLRNKLQQGVEKFFKYGLYITIYANDVERLDKEVSKIQSMLEARLIYSKPALFETEQAFQSTIPLGNDELNVNNNMNSGPLSTTFPFVSSDLTSNDGVLYGINRHNNSLVLFDRFSMENANMVIFAKSGAGKSYAVKLEVLRSLMMGIDVITIDPEYEYKYLAETVGGSFLKVSLTSEHHINPFDLPDPKVLDEDPEDVLRGNIVELIGLLRLMMGTVTPEEESILDQAIRETYAIRDITAETDWKKATVPTMSDLQSVLSNMTGAEDLSVRLKKYTEGIFAGFLNQQTNVDLKRQFVVFSIRDMEDELKPIAMYIIMHYIWNLIRQKLKKRILVVDEAWIMMKYEEAAAFLFTIAKRCRKYFLGLSTITQDVEDFMVSRYGKAIVTNSSMQLLLKQSSAAIDVLVDLFYLTDEEKFLLLESDVGEGIFFAGLKHAAIKVIASYTEDQIITSDPRQLLEIEEAKEELAQ
jgi:type IV secretory pathway VirB4 component